MAVLTYGDFGGDINMSVVDIRALFDYENVTADSENIILFNLSLIHI